MPTLNVQTNVPVDGVVLSDILKDASKAIARILGKPESYVMIIIRGGIPMSFGGTEEPAAYGELVAIGGINPASNKKVSAAISELFESKLSVPSSRFYIKFYDVKLLEWLEGFAERLKGRTNAVAHEVQQVVEEIDAVELNLQNTFNNFRRLSSSQFVENHVYEEDETDLVSARISKKDAKKPSVPTESYEDEILPRYKDAVASAWAAFKASKRQNDQSSVKSRSRNKLILPHIIGAEEFTRDVHCGLADLRDWHRDPELDDIVGQDRASLAAESVDTGMLSEEEISERESQGLDSQEESVEPAVSAALDFKAMLEAALRNPYDGGASDESLFVGLPDNKFSLPYVTSDSKYNSPRTISTMVDIIGRTMTTMDESKEELRDSTSQQLNANENKMKLPLATESLEALDNSMPSSILEELLKKPLNTSTQAMLNQEFKEYIDSNNGNRQAGTSDLGHVPIIPGGYVSDELLDSGFLQKEDATVFNSNTGPTIPEGLFQEELCPEPIRDSTSESQSFPSLDSSRILPSLLDIVPGSSRRESDIVLVTSERSGSGKSQIESSVVTNHSSLHSASSDISSFSNTFLGSLQGGQVPSRGGLFDDDDEDEDADDLFGAAAPRVDTRSLRPWASQSSKGLFDDFATENDGTTSVSDAGVSQEAQQNSAISPVVTSQFGSSSGLGVLDFLSAPVVSANVETYSGTTDVDLASSSIPRESVSNNQEDLNEVTQLPLRSTEAATLRSFIDESDDDSWAGSENGADDLIQGENVIQQHAHHDAATKVSGNSDIGANTYQSTAEGVIGLKSEALVHTGHLVQSVSSKDDSLPVGGANAFVSAQPAPEGVSSRFPPTTSSSTSSTESSPVKVLVNLAENPLMQSKILESLDSEASDSSDSASSSSDVHGVRQRGLVQNFSSGTSFLFEDFGPSTSQPPNRVKQTGSPLSKDTGHNRTSESWRKKISSRNLPVAVNEVGRSTRAFAPLFEDDEAEEDLFGRISPQQQGALFPGTGKPGIVLSSSTTLPITPGQSMVEETEASFTTRDVRHQTPPESNPSSDIPLSSRSTSVEKGDVFLSSAKPGSKLSSLLFGDDDEEDEDALFGPLGGRTSRVLNSGKGESIFNDLK